MWQEFVNLLGGVVKRPNDEQTLVLSLEDSKEFGEWRLVVHSA